MDCVVGDGFVVCVSDGIGGAGDLIDLGLGVRDFGWDDSPETCGFKGPGEGCGCGCGCGCAGCAAGRSLGPGWFSGASVWSTEHLLSSRMVNS